MKYIIQSTIKNINTIKRNLMKVTRELIDNGQKIIHINYEKKDIKKVKKYQKKILKKLEEEKKALEPESIDSEE